MLIVFAGIFLAVGAFLLIDAATARSRQRKAALAQVPDYADPTLSVSRIASVRRARERRRKLTARPFAEALARFALRASGEGSLEKVQGTLTSAGLGGRITATTLLASKVILGATGLVLGVIVGSAAGGVAQAVVLCLVGGAVAFMAPSVYVGQRARNRRERIRAELPTAFDLLSISVEAGLSLDAALAILTERLEGPLADELRYTLGELQVGESRREALRKLAQRIDLPEMTSFSNAVQQGDRLGIALSGILRNVSEDARRVRRAEAEERASKTQVKLLFPIIFFFLPTIFIFTLGPAMLNFQNTFK